MTDQVMGISNLPGTCITNSRSNIEFARDVVVGCEHREEEDRGGRLRHQGCEDENFMQLRGSANQFETQSSKCIDVSMTLIK